MLILSRRPYERIRVTAPDGTVIWVSCVGQSSQGHTRIGIDAPPGAKIVREEIIPKQEPTP